MQSHGVGHHGNKRASFISNPFSLSFFMQHPLLPSLDHMKNMLSSLILLEEPPPPKIETYTHRVTKKKETKRVCCCSCAHVSGDLVLGEDVVKVLFVPECAKGEGEKPPHLNAVSTNWLICFFKK